MKNNINLTKADFTELYMMLAQQNDGAAYIVYQLTKENPLYALYLDLLEIRGYDLWKFYIYCSGYDLNKLMKTSRALCYLSHTKEDIARNLELDEPVPFFDNSIKVDGIGFYDKEFDFDNKNLREAIFSLNRENMLAKLNKKISESSSNDNHSR